MELQGFRLTGQNLIPFSYDSGTAQWPSRCLLFSTHEKSMRLIQTNLSLRDRCAHWSWQSASPNAARKHTATAKRNGFPRRFAQRDGGIPRFINLPPSPFRGNDRGNLYIAFSFTYWQSLKSGDPSVSFADSVSLRLGHSAALTCYQHVIHYRAAASLPKRGVKGGVPRYSKANFRRRCTT